MKNMYGGWAASDKQVLHFFIFADNEKEALSKLHKEVKNFPDFTAKRFSIAELKPNLQNPGVYFI